MRIFEGDFVQKWVLKTWNICRKDTFFIPIYTETANFVPPSRDHQTSQVATGVQRRAWSLKIWYTRRSDIAMGSLVPAKFWGCTKQGAVSIRKTVLPCMAIPMLKIRRPNGRLIFNMEIAIRRYDGLYIETGPRSPWSFRVFETVSQSLQYHGLLNWTLTCLGCVQMDCCSSTPVCTGQEIISFM